jgi:rubrerythrin
MSFNPFNEKPKKIDNLFMSFEKMSPKPYDKNEVDPYTRVRCILMNGTEFEAVWCKHHFNRHFDDNDARRDVAFLRRSEQQQQKLISSLKPIDENLLETTIGYEQLAVDLTAYMGERATDKNTKNALDFALLEDFDHLYRYANMLETDMGVHAEHYVGNYTEIMPGRPTISHHRHPFDTVRYHRTNSSADLITKLDTMIITAAEQQTMNYYMNLGSFYRTQKGREIYAEIAMVEEDHVTHYGSLLDPNTTLFESLLMHEYTECYLYYSMYLDEVDKNIKKIWEMLLSQEIIHLNIAKNLLEKYEKKSYLDVIPLPDFPDTIKFKNNKEYIRKVIAKTVNWTTIKENYIDYTKLDDNADFFKYQNNVITNPEKERGHTVILEHIDKFGKDYRLCDKEHPIKDLRNRTTDNICVGRC